MHIAAYQIHNILKVYSKKLTQGRLLNRQGTSDTESTEDKRQAVVDKVASDIVDRITKQGLQKEDSESVSQNKAEIKNTASGGADNNNTDFIFNVIDQNNEKTTNSMSVENPDFLAKRLEQLAKEAVHKNMK